ncbi:TRAP transporter large permease subunit [Gracilibacillus salitolerans]|uniref:TRAP transporter large permease subunit n=1 Tax=Gracilibacillus salitolerans TaxID=2663022 RepID=A0A5Q2TIR7_9BACI|nr:TRAP transporter large permease [Gracilibacillus salitolerans]QGH33922.1 TRAP transporter large permease subunit [Gracilibacillus salitolerans]
MDASLLATIVLFGSFFVLLVIGVPISIGIGISSVLAALTLVPLDMISFTAAQKLFQGIDSFTLLAIIFFMLSGSIMNNGGIAIRLINLAKLFVGRMPGALAHTNVVGNMLFGSISGSAVASAAAIGSVMSPLQKKEKYDPSFSAAVNIASAPTGLLIPPTTAFIVYSLVSGGTSISALFMAGYLPGILMGLSIMVVAYFIAKKEKYPVSEKVTFKQGVRVVLDAIPSLSLIVVVIGGIVAGIFTATEGAAVAVLYSAILAAIYREIKIPEIPAILKEAIVMTGIVLFLVGASSIMSWVMAYAGIPQQITNILLSISENPIIILLLMNIILLAVGIFMDITPAILIFTPIFLPIVTNIGIDPVHFGVILIFNLCIGITTPPVGSALFVGSSVANVSIESVVRPLFKLYIPLVIALLLVTYFEWISLFIPRLFGLM